MPQPVPDWVTRNRLYIPDRFRILPPVMDIFWTICTMPIGVALVMLPAAVVWWLVDRKKPGPDAK